MEKGRTNSDDGIALHRETDMAVNSLTLLIEYQNLYLHVVCVSNFMIVGMCDMLSLQVYDEL
jgi:hypothetical protein